jgi:hypothetical protein
MAASLFPFLPPSATLFSNFEERPRLPRPDLAWLPPALLGLQTAQPPSLLPDLPAFPVRPLLNLAELEKKGMAETLAVTLKLGKKTAGGGVEKNGGREHESDDLLLPPCESHSHCGSPEIVCRRWLKQPSVV